MVSVEKARKTVYDLVPKSEIELVEIREILNRVLAQDIIAPFPQPRFTNSAMDGFAVRWQDTANANRENPVKLKLVDISSAGEPADLEVKPGQCIQCMTGAALPTGADSIIIVEETSGFESGEFVEIYKPAKPGQNIRYRGEEIKKDEVLISRGCRIGAAEVGVIATFGYSEIQVFKRPKIAIFATGDELQEPGEKLKDGQIYNSNLYVLTSLAKNVGAEVISQSVVKDNPKSVSKFLSKALGECDIVITSGGVSVGRYDYVRDVLVELGISEHFRKVAQKPGKPMFFGSADNVLIFGLPGNPVSSFICFMEYIWFAIERWMGYKPEEKFQSKLSVQFPRDQDKNRFIFGQVWIEKGQFVCLPSVKTGSHMLTSSLDANCIIEVEKGNGVLAKGSEVSVRVLPWKRVVKKRL